MLTTAYPNYVGDNRKNLKEILVSKKTSNDAQGGKERDVIYMTGQSEAA